MLMINFPQAYGEELTDNMTTKILMIGKGETDDS
jgi:hypothetical protein